MRKYGNKVTQICGKLAQFSRLAVLHGIRYRRVRLCVCMCLIQMFKFSILLDAIDDESNFMFMFEIVKIQCLVTVFTLAL